jgi:hypothetical protein
MLEKREMLLHKKMAAELEKAKDFNRAKNKRAALQCLKKKKLYEQQIEQLQNQQLKLEEQVITLEGSKTTAETFTALKSGAGAMKQLHKETNIDEVDKVRPDLSSKESNPKDLTVDLSLTSPLPHPLTHSTGHGRHQRADGEDAAGAGRPGPARGVRRGPRRGRAGRGARRARSGGSGR